MGDLMISGKSPLPLPKFNIAPEKLPKPNRKVVFQPSFFRGELLNFGGVTVDPPSHPKECMFVKPFQPIPFMPRLLESVKVLSDEVDLGEGGCHEKPWKTNKVPKKGLFH